MLATEDMDTGETKCGVAPNIAHETQHLDVINYDVVAWSGYSADYHPRNIKENKPHDQASRWSSDTITFGKFRKLHVCNLKEFKVYGGLHEDNMTELQHSGLRNDEEPETFPVRHKIHGLDFPCRYIKIVPLQAYGANFNFSIWFVQLQGVADPPVVARARALFEEHLEREAVRLCLKHFRQRNQLDVFEALQARTKMPLEDPMLTDLHDKLVRQGDLDACEQIMRAVCGQGLMQEYIHSLGYQARWSRIIPVDRSVFLGGRFYSHGQESSHRPSARGGHQMCLDAEAGVIYLLGGYDGRRDLADFWAYSIRDNMWTCISENTEDDGGPGRQSCHKMCFDSVRRRLFTLGRFVDTGSRPQSEIPAEFYFYDLTHRVWVIINEDAPKENGPPLIYDHQMVFDPKSGGIIVFGGRDVNAAEITYSGLYHYDIEENIWTRLRSDDQQPSNSIQLKSRIGHSMVVNPDTRQLYIFHGQRHKENLSDFYTYNLHTGQVEDMVRDCSKDGGPDANYTQRATFDASRGEIYVLTGLMKDNKNSQPDAVMSSLWVYNCKAAAWRKIYQRESTDIHLWDAGNETEPRPRYAHQFVLDPTTGVHYMFGGNPGDNSSRRLDDFWALELHSATPEEVLRKALFLIRRQKFKEICMVDGIRALAYLQSDLAAVVDHTDPEQSAEFRTLTTTLFAAHEASRLAGEVYGARTQLYEDLLKFFPKHMKQPTGNLLDLVMTSLASSGAPRH